MNFFVKLYSDYTQTINRLILYTIIGVGGDLMKSIASILDTNGQVTHKPSFIWWIMVAMGAIVNTAITIRAMMDSSHAKEKAIAQCNSSTSVTQTTETTVIPSPEKPSGDTIILKS